MDWIKYIGAIGIGAVIAKVLDIFWLQKVMEESEKRKWLRDNQLRAFSELAKEILSLRLSKGVLDFDNPFEFYGIAAESMLLIEDSEIKDRINNFIISLDTIFNKKIESEYEKIVAEAHAIVGLLGSSLMKNKQKDWIKRLFKR